MSFDDLSGTIIRKICMACSREYQGASVRCPSDGNELVELPSDQWVGKKLLGKYQMQSILGTGGMGVVYLAWDEMVERRVAIKMLRPQYLSDTQSVRRFQREAKAATRLKHGNAIIIYEFGIVTGPAGGQPYMVMDFLEGIPCDCIEKQAIHCPHHARSLWHDIKKLGYLSPERSIHILAQACDALDHAHRQGVIHRDVKPQNIMIVPQEDDLDHCKVVDFGVAKLMPINTVGEEGQSLTQVGEVCGSPVYMSPEQCLGQNLDARADIYSMGVVAFECLTGKVPFLGKNMVETMSKHYHEKPPTFSSIRKDLNVPERLEQIVMKALSKEPHLRQQSMAELAQDLRFAIPHPAQSINLRIAQTPEPQPAVERRNSWIIPAVAGAVVTSLIAVLAVSFFGPKTPAPQTVTPTQPPVTSAQPPVTIEKQPPVIQKPSAIERLPVSTASSVQSRPIHPIKRASSRTGSPALSADDYASDRDREWERMAVERAYENEPILTKTEKRVRVVKPTPTYQAQPARATVAKPAGKDPFADLADDRSYTQKQK